MLFTRPYRPDLSVVDFEVATEKSGTKLGFRQGHRVEEITTSFLRDLYFSESELKCFAFGYFLASMNFRVKVLSFSVPTSSYGLLVVPCIVYPKIMVL
jgi:hypothetical protein